LSFTIAGLAQTGYSERPLELPCSVLLPWYRQASAADGLPSRAATPTLCGAASNISFGRSGCAATWLPDCFTAWLPGLLAIHALDEQVQDLVIALDAAGLEDRLDLAAVASECTTQILASPKLRSSSADLASLIVNVGLLSACPRIRNVDLVHQPLCRVHSHSIGM